MGHKAKHVQECVSLVVLRLCALLKEIFLYCSMNYVYVCVFVLEDKPHRNYVINSYHSYSVER